MRLNDFSYNDFINKSTAQSLGKFGEFLFSKFCQLKNIPCRSRHKDGIDFSIEHSLLVDVKSVRHIKHSSRASFRRHNIEKQIPGVVYAYIIFWKDSVELRVEKSNNTFANYDCFFDESFINSVWSEFDRKSVKFLDKKHVEATDSLKTSLTLWISTNLNLKGRVIQRKATANLSNRKGGWGADNFYSKPPHKHQIVVLLFVDNGLVTGIHSYPTAEHMHIVVHPKPVGTNRKEILCYDVSQLADRYKFNSIEDFKSNVKLRFGL